MIGDCWLGEACERGKGLHCTVVPLMKKKLMIVTVISCLIITVAVSVVLFTI